MNKRHLLSIYQSLLYKKIVVALLAIALGLTLIPAQPVEAGTASKSIVEAGPYAPGQEVTVQIKFTEPDIAITPSVELVIVVDTSRSITSGISDMKAKLLSFIDTQLVNYPGAVRVGLTKIGNGTAAFDSNNSNNPVANTQMFYAGTTNPLPNSSVGVDQVVTIDSGNIAALRAAVNAIAVEPTTNPNSPDGMNSYTSDLGPGLARARGMFTGASNVSRFAVLLTDGMATKGYCPINGSAQPAVAFPAGTQLQVLPAGDDWVNNKYVQSEYRTEDSNFPSYYPYNHGEPGVCKPFIVNYYSSTGLQAKTMTQQIASRYGGIYSTDIKAGTLDKVVADAKIATISFQDTLNGSVFNGITTWVGLYNCSTGSPGALYSGSSWTVSGNTGTLVIPSSIVNAIDSYCVRFKARLGSTPPSGALPINTSGNTIVYKNSKGATLATDTISPGSMNVQAYGDLDVSQIQTTNSTGTYYRVFSTTQDIFVRFVSRNLSTTTTVPTGAITQIYSNAPNPVAAGTLSDVGIRFSHTSFPVNYSRAHQSFAGGQDEASFTGNNSFRKAAGDYTARANINYQHAASSIDETSYTNNQNATYNYSVVTQPTSLQTTSVVCNAASVSWTGRSANVTNYQVTLSPADGGTFPVNSSGSTSHDFTGLKALTSYTWHVRAVTANGTSAWLASSTFKTPACPTFDASTPSPLVITPGDPTPYAQNINISYLPGATEWQNPVGHLTVRVLDIIAGNATCSMASNAPANNAVANGLHVDISGASTAAERSVVYNTSPVVFDVYSDEAGATGLYTVCFGVFSPDAHITHTIPPLSLTVRVEKRPWVQVDRPGSSAGSMTGDVHSNGTINISIPLNQYFFRNGVAGVLTARNQVYGIPESRFSNVVSKLWRIPNYNRLVNTPTYDNLRATIVNNLNNANITQGPPINANINALCGGSNTKHVIEYTPASGTASKDDVIDLANSNCVGKNVVIFINGNMKYNADIIDNTQDSSITFIVRGNATVDPSVTRLDGVHIFGGTFRDGSVYNRDGSVFDKQLVINGSLIGLAGNAPTSGSGTFSLASDSGLERNLGIGANGNDTNAGERINYQPKYLFLLRELMGTASYTWTE